MNEYVTNNLALAAYLLIKGWQVREERIIPKDRGREVHFTFASEAERDAEGFTKREPIPALPYSEALRYLKSRVTVLLKLPH